MIEPLGITFPFGSVRSPTVTFTPERFPWSAVTINWKASVSFLAAFKATVVWPAFGAVRVVSLPIFTVACSVQTTIASAAWIDQSTIKKGTSLIAAPLSPIPFFITPPCFKYTESHEGGVRFSPGSSYEGPLDPTPYPPGARFSHQDFAEEKIADLPHKAIGKGP